MWEVIAAVFRPDTLDDRVVAPMGPGGNSKSTLAALLRYLCGGPVAAPNLSIADFEHEFAAESLIGAKAVIGDENAVGAYYTNIKRFKSAVSKEMISINRKYQKEIGYRFSGMIFEPLNEMPKFKDTTLSSWRRWLILPMLNKFATSGGKRPEIKSDFIKRKEVLEYFAWRALSMEDRKSTRLNSSHVAISYAVFCLKKKRR